MEATGLVFRPVASFHKLALDEFSGEFYCYNKKKGRDSGVCLVKGRSCFGLLSSGFSDSKHVEYYLAPKVEGKKEKEKEKGFGDEMKTVKKKLKLVKRLSKDLSLFSDMAASDADSGNRLMGEVKGRMIEEAMEVLQAQLQFMKSEQKELKRKKKEEKQMKATLMKSKANCEESSASSSSSSSDTGDSECGEVTDMSHLRNSASEQAEETKAQQPVIQDAAPSNLSLMTQTDCSEARDECCTDIKNIQNNSAVVRTAEQKIEVCMGGKCKKMGAASLLEEFNRKVGMEGTVVRCKCMGKCRDGPNVRVLNNQDKLQLEKTAQGSAKTRLSPLCLNVGLEDVDLIVAELLGEDWSSKQLLAPA